MRTLCLLFGSLTLFAQIPEIQRGSLDLSSEQYQGNGAIDLFSTFDGRATPAYTIACQNFTDPVLNGFSVYAADDFVIPDSVTRWEIEEISVFGTYFNGDGPADSLNVYIWAHDAKAELPASVDIASALYSAENITYEDQGVGDFRIPLPGGVSLGPGRYWVCVQPNMEVGVGGQWGWTESSAGADTGLIVGFESAWYQEDSPILIPPETCVGAWGRRVTECLQTNLPATAPFEHDLAFLLIGQEITTVAASVNGPLTVSESGTAVSFDVTLTQEPTDTVTVGVSSSDASEGVLTTLTERGPVTVEGVLNFEFTTDDWDQPRSVSLTGLPDNVLDGTQEFSLVFAPAVSNDPQFDGIKPRDITAVNTEILCLTGVITDQADSVNPAYDGLGNILAFASDGTFGEGMSREIFIYDRTTGFQQITTAGGTSDHPSLDDDANLLAFASDSLQPTEGNIVDIYLYNLELQTFTRVTDSTGAATGSTRPVISGDGSVIVFISDADFAGENPDGSREAFLYDVGAATLIQVSDDPGDDPTAHVEDVAVTGDGSQVLYTKELGGRMLYRYQVAGGSTEVVNTGNNQAPAISRDGARIAVVSDVNPLGQNGDGNMEVFVFDDIRGGFPLQVTNTTESGFVGIGMSGAGAFLSFAGAEDPLGENSDGGMEVFTFDLDTFEMFQATDLPASVELSGWSLGGRWLAYGSGEAGAHLLNFSWLSDLDKELPDWPEALQITDLIERICN